MMISGVDEHLSMNQIPTELLKNIWDGMYEEYADEFEGIIEDIHLELNMRGEGEYCAV